MLLLHDGSNPRKGSSITLLVVAGAGAILFTLVAGFFVYGNTRRLVSSKDWVEHTQEVLNTIEREERLVERTELTEQMYAVTRNESLLNRARETSIELEANAFRIRNLVMDNHGQDENVARLTACAADLNRNVSALIDRQPATFAALFPCRETLSFMVEQERALKKERISSSERNSSLSVDTGFVLVGLFLTTTLVLFGFLLRDALRRQSSEREMAISNGNLEASLEAMEEHNRETRLLATYRDELQLCVDVEQVYRAAAKAVVRLAPESRGSLYAINASRNMLELVAGWGDEEDPGKKAVDTFMPDDCCGLRVGQLRWRRPGVSEIDCNHFLAGAPERYLCIPIVAQGQTIGVLHVECVEDEALMWVQQRLESLRQVLQLTGMTLAALNLRTKLLNQSIRDSLTGLFNRHFMEIVLTRELARAGRQLGTLAVFMVDVDHFKRFNDNYGHAAGDAMLKAISEVFTNVVRTEDTVCRYGGEEFAIILPGITAEAACQRAERIREAVSHLRVDLGDGACGETTVSIGIALYPRDADEGERLLRKADQALYDAKHAGRNQYALAGILARA